MELQKYEIGLESESVHVSLMLY